MPGPKKSFDRDAALDRAAEVFWRKGYEGTSVDDLLQAMGLSRSSLYSTFGDKKALFIETLQRWFDDQIEMFMHELRGPGRLDERLIRALRRKHAEQAALGGVGCFFGNTVAESGHLEPEIAELLQSFPRRLRRVLQRTFDEGVRAGELPEGTDTETLARFVLTFGQGVALMGRLEEGAFDAMVPLLGRVMERGVFEGP